MKRFFLLFLPFFAFAQESNPFESAILSLLEQFQGGESKDKDFTVTEHTIHLKGEPLRYSAITGTLNQYLDNGDVAGKIFFTAYIKEPSDEDRPVTFLFEGGPGGSSLAMHIGGLGPKRLLLPEEGQKSHPPYKIIDNQETLLGETDLVLIDPIGTGYSKAENDVYKNAYFGVESDLFSFTEFIRMFCIHFDRWNSPKYLLGASYGTARACGLAESLLSLGVHVNGVILMSCALDYNVFVGMRDAPLSDCLSIPSMAATAWYHGRGMQELSLEEVVEYARRFALDEYAPVMMQPTRLSPLEKRAFYQKLASLIGLPPETIARYEARIDERIYTTEFFAAERKIIGGCDTRYIGDVSSVVAEHHEDPSYRDFRPALYPAFLSYMQTELQTKSYSPKYISFSHEAINFWNWQTYDNPHALPNFMQRLRRSLVVNPEMKVYVGSGYFDLRTTLAATEYSLEHLELPDSYKKNFQIEYYPAGHAFIFDLTSLKKFKQDLVKFYSNP